MPSVPLLSSLPTARRQRRNTRRTASGDARGTRARAGAATTSSTIGAAAAAIPLARAAVRFGRRLALALGALTAALGSITAIVAVGLNAFPMLLLGFVLLGVGTAVGLQARFAATDAASAATRGRDLSIVVWSTTVGAVAGPNLVGPGGAVADALGLPENTGSFAIALVAQVLASATYVVALRPDPLRIASGRAVDFGPAPNGGAVRSRSTLFFAIGAIALSHAIMVSVMAMTPVHMLGHGSSLTIIGFTISLHIAGMYALSPIFGWASDRLGRVPVILIGQALFAVALPIVAIAGTDDALITLGLVLLGLGWSAATVAGSALVSDLVTGAERVRVQGRTDLVMSLAGALGGALAGPVLAGIGYDGLAVAAGVLVVAVVTGAVAVRSQRPVAV